MKCIMAVMVVCIHIHPFGAAHEMLMPVYRCAVPIFAMISSYLAFSKLSDERERDNNRILGTVKRYLLLYAFWLVVLSVPTIQMNGWYHGNPIDVIADIIISFLFGSTFKASWFLVGMVWCIPIVYLLTRTKVGTVVSVLLGIFCFACSAVFSNYAGVHVPIISDAAALYSANLAYIHNSFPALMLYVVIGAIAGRNADKIRNMPSHSRGLLYVLSFIGILAVYFEKTIITSNGWSNYDDVYLSLLIPCVSIFMLTISSKWSMLSNDTVGFLGAFSTVTYCIHFTMSSVLRSSCPDVCGIDTVRFIIVLLICFVTTVIVTKLAKNDDMEAVKYSF